MGGKTSQCKDLPVITCNGWSAARAGHHFSWNAHLGPMVKQNKRTGGREADTMGWGWVGNRAEQKLKEDLSCWSLRTINKWLIVFRSLNPLQKLKLHTENIKLIADIRFLYLLSAWKVQQTKLYLFFKSPWLLLLWDPLHLRQNVSFIWKIY